MNTNKLHTGNSAVWLALCILIALAILIGFCASGCGTIPASWNDQVTCDSTSYYHLGRKCGAQALLELEVRRLRTGVNFNMYEVNKLADSLSHTEWPEDKK